jgi:chemotaxis protein MotB
MENTKGGGAFEKSDMSVGERVTEEFLKRQQNQMKELADKIQQEMSKTENLKDLMKQIKMEFTKEGLRIELVEESQSFFFDVGTSHLKNEAVLILTLIAKELGKLQNDVVVEGHTDARPYLGGNGYTNFELSAERANSARRILMDTGLRGKQIVEIRGYADSRLRNKLNPLDDTNRRISILVKYDEQ